MKEIGNLRRVGPKISNEKKEIEVTVGVAEGESRDGVKFLYTVEADIDNEIDAICTFQVHGQYLSGGTHAIEPDEEPELEVLSLKTKDGKNIEISEFSESELKEICENSFE